MIHSILSRLLKPHEEYISGTADLTGLIDEKFGQHRFGISIGKKLDDCIVDGIENGPTLEYFHHYNQVNRELTGVAEEFREELRKLEIDAIVIPPTINLGSKDYEKYLSTLTYGLSHKMVATQAGLGWIGKTALFISKEFGPRLRLVSILVGQQPDTVSIPITRSRCGKCTICVERCPAQAATGQLWNVQIHRDAFFNAAKCREKCGELAKKKLNVEERICGLCVSVCPVGKKKKGLQVIPGEDGTMPADDNVDCSLA
ncbi:MAG: hypothetical protein PHD61_12870 [Bacteroidales bacterium]|nr:epoxyqueuosine reductase [Lentimicrobiaceae bacterium]MDD5696180.1 hypothetical protein [Bacteroidales bacterium]